MNDYMGTLLERFKIETASAAAIAEQVKTAEDHLREQLGKEQRRLLLRLTDLHHALHEEVQLGGFIAGYAYPLLAHFDNTLGNTLKNAFLLPLANPFLALVVTALNLLPVLLLLINPGLFARCAVFWLLVGCALTAVINAKMLGRFFARLVPEEEKIQTDGDDEDGEDL